MLDYWAFKYILVDELLTWTNHQIQYIFSLNFIVIPNWWNSAPLGWFIQLQWWDVVLHSAFTQPFLLPLSLSFPTGETAPPLFGLSCWQWWCLVLHPLSRGNQTGAGCKGHPLITEKLNQSILSGRWELLLKLCWNLATTVKLSRSEKKNTLS